MEPEKIKYESGERTLVGYYVRPKGPGLDGPFPAVIWNHGSDAEPHFPEQLAKAYLDRGFVFFFPIRRFHVPNVKLGETIMDIIEAASDTAAKWCDMQEVEVHDVFNALAWLKKKDFVDPARIIVSGCSFGGVQTLLAAEQGADEGFKAAVPFAPGAISWGDGEGKINDFLKASVKRRKIPMFILQAHNDYSLGPSKVLGPLLEEKPNLLHKVKQYPDFEGPRTKDMTDEDWHKHGHGGFATRGSAIWGDDVSAFIEEALGPAGDTHVLAIDPHGKPDVPQKDAYLVWRDVEGWHMRTVANTKGGAAHFRGMISVKGGTLEHLHGVATGKKDRFIMGPDDRSVTFDFTTLGSEKDQQDGITFTVSGADAMLSFKLEIGEANPKFDGDRIFIGEHGKHPRVNPFKLAEIAEHDSSAMIRLFGTTTSPYVRRVRIVAGELALPCELIDTSSEAGQAMLRERSPIWKVPAAEIAGTLVFDSHVITELLIANHGAGKLAALAIDDLEARNIISVIDGALDALINCLYLQRDGITGIQSAYVTKQHERAAASLTWLETRVRGEWLTRHLTLGLPEIALVTALGWMRFRSMVVIDRWPALLACFEQWDARDGFASTRPM